MFYAGRRPMGRLFYLGLVGVMLAGAGRARPLPAAQTGPAMTTVSDTVYRADGSPAQGAAIITWPAFVTADGTAVAAGTTNVRLGTNGALSVALVPNVGATPAGAYYAVVFQLGPGEVKTENWIVPTTSPANLAAVRTTPGSGLATQPVSIQYVNTALASKANDNAVVHLNGSETISGSKNFAVAPSVPTPTSTGQVANKAYVDSSVATVGSGNFLATAGGTMTGPITLPANPATMVAPATVLYDDVIAGAPAFCTYTLVNAVNLHCSFAYTYATHISLAEVRTALPGSGYVTQLAGPLADGAQCFISDPTLGFYPQYVPALNELIVVSYRGFGRAVAEVNSSTSVLSLQHGADDGVRGAVKVAKAPSARTGTDCENAALAILDDAVARAWSGTYETWSDFLPGGASDIFPGDALAVNVPSQGASFTAIVRQVGIEVLDAAGDRGMYMIEFANDLAVPLALQCESSATTVRLQDMPPRLTTAQAGTYYVADLKEAQITQVTSTTTQVDAGTVLPSGCGIEVRMHDYGWGPANDRNLLGRFSTQTFTLPRLARTQNYFLRMYDSSSPPRYSRYSAALHLDYPL